MYISYIYSLPHWKHTFSKSIILNVCSNVRITHISKLLKTFSPSFPFSSNYNFEIILKLYSVWDKLRLCVARYFGSVDQTLYKCAGNQDDDTLNTEISSIRTILQLISNIVIFYVDLWLHFFLFKM